MELWHYAMLLTLLLGYIPAQERWTRIRVWAAMIGGSMAAHVTTWLMPPSWVIWCYIAIDLICAFIILLPPKTDWQRGIGFCYAGMAFLTVGFATTLEFFSSAVGDPNMLKNGNDLFAWAALVLLCLWGIDGLLQSSNASERIGGSRVPAQRADT